MADMQPLEPVLSARRSIVLILVGEWVEDPESECSIHRRNGRGFAEQGYALGFVLHDRKCIVTCAHVIEGREPDDVLIIERANPNAPSILKSTFRGADFDVALLYLVDPVEAPPIVVSDKRKVWVGEDVFFWSPLVQSSSSTRTRGLTLCLRKSIVSAVWDNRALDPGTSEPRHVLIDAVVPEGSSGSPLVRRDGRLVGMVFAEQMRPSNVLIPSGMGWALPGSIVADSTSKIAEQCRLEDSQ